MTTARALTLRGFLDRALYFSNDPAWRDALQAQGINAGQRSADIAADVQAISGAVTGTDTLVTVMTGGPPAAPQANVNASLAQAQTTQAELDAFSQGWSQTPAPDVDTGTVALQQAGLVLGPAIANTFATLDAASAPAPDLQQATQGAEAAATAIEGLCVTTQTALIGASPSAGVFAKATQINASVNNGLIPLQQPTTGVYARAGSGNAGDFVTDTSNAQVALDNVFNTLDPWLQNTLQGGPPATPDLQAVASACLAALDQGSQVGPFRAAMGATSLAGGYPGNAGTDSLGLLLAWLVTALP